MSVSDAALIEQAKAGSKDAFCSLAQRHRDPLFRFLWFRCGNRADAEDAVQDALLNAWRYLDSYDSRWQFTTWLYRIALRKLPDTRNETTQIDKELPGTDDVLDTMERDNLWRVARDTLKHEPLLAMWLHYGEGASQQEVAHALSRSVSWVKVNLMRSRNQLTAALAESTG
ncbi:MAG: sigma-70 family RNA polymerase sigma factor [Pseudomonadota bacterium]